MTDENIVQQSPEVDVATDEEKADPVQDASNQATPQETTQEPEDQGEPAEQDTQAAKIAESDTVKPSDIIPPTPGRVVWYYQDEHQEQPFAATVAYVWHDRKINIGYLDQNGAHKNATHILLVQPGDPRPSHGYCAWMPYQIGQAKQAA